MSLPKEYYVIIYKDDTIELFIELKSVLRLDVKLIFQAKYTKRSPKHVFYGYVAMNAKGVAYKNNTFSWAGIKCKFTRDEFWGVVYKDEKGNGVILSVEIKDKLGVVLEKRFYNDDNKLGGFKTMIKYLNLLDRVGTHQGAQEVYTLSKELTILKRKRTSLKK